MRHWLKTAFAVAAPLLLSSCLWGPGKFKSDLTLHKDGSFVLDYRGEIVLQFPDESPRRMAWTETSATCFVGQDGTKRLLPVPPGPPAPPPPPRVIRSSASAAPLVIAVPSPAPPNIVTIPAMPAVVGATRSSPLRWPSRRPCTKAEIASQKADFEKRETERVGQARKKQEEMAKVFGLPGLDDESSRAFARKLMKYAGWRSVTYRGKGVYDVDYHFVGSARQDFLFPALPDNDLLLPFVAIRQRADGTLLVTAPAFTGAAGPLAARAAMAGNPSTGMISRAQGRFTVVTDGEILTNNSEDGPSANAGGRELRWDVNPASKKIPEALVRL